MLKFHDDPTVNESGIIILLTQVWVYAEKKEGFGKGIRKNKIERKRKRRDVSLVVKKLVELAMFG